MYDRLDGLKAWQVVKRGVEIEFLALPDRRAFIDQSTK